MPKRTRGGKREKARKQRKLDLQREQIQKEGFYPGKPRITHEKIGKFIVDPGYVKHLLRDKCKVKWTLNNNEVDKELHYLAANVTDKLELSDGISECETIILEPERLRELNYIYSDLLNIDQEHLEIEEINKDGILEVTFV